MTETAQTAPVPLPAKAATSAALPNQTVGVFYGQLAGLLRAGMPLPRALATLAQDSDAPAFRGALERAAKAMESGVSAEEAFGAESRELGGILGQAVAASAATGKMPALLAELSAWTLAQDKIYRQIAGLMTYPYMVLTITSLLCTTFLIVAQSMDMGTPVDMDLGQSARAPYFLFPNIPIALSLTVTGGVLAGCLLIPLLNFFARRDNGLRRWRESLLLRLPLAGAVCRPLALSRLCGGLAILLKAGRPLHEAVAAAGALSGFTPYAEAAARASEQLKAGGDLAGAWTGGRLFPASFRHILASAQQRGDIPEAFAQLSELYQAEAEARSRIVGVLAPPAFLVFAGVLIAFTLLGLFDPLFRSMISFLSIMERIGR